MMPVTLHVLLNREILGRYAAGPILGLLSRNPRHPLPHRLSRARQKPGLYRQQSHILTRCTRREYTWFGSAPSPVAWYKLSALAESRTFHTPGRRLLTAPGTPVW